MVQEDRRLRRRVRNSYFISTVSIAMVLFLLGSVTYLIMGALSVTDRLRESVTIYVMLDDGVSEEQKAAIGRQIEAQEVVRQAVYVPKELAAERFIAESGDDFTGFIDFNPLPDSFEAKLGTRSSEKDLVEGFVKAAEAMPGVNEVVWQRGVVESIGTNLGKFQIVLLLFGGALLFISLTLLGNTIRMTIIARRRTINTMKLVGAGRGFIMRPFVGSAVLHGLYAGIIAVAMFALLILGLREGIPEIRLLTGDLLLGGIAGGMLVLGVVISLLFTLVAVNRALRQTSGKSYM